MKRLKIIGLIMFALMSMSGYAQCDFKTFINTYFDTYDANDSLIELGMGTRGSHKKQIDKNDILYDCAIKYFPSRVFSYYSCHINDYYVLMFWKDYDIDDDYVIDDNLFVLCNESGEILDQYTHRKVTRSYMASYRFYLQKDTLIWRYWDEKDSLGSYFEIQFKIIKDKIVPQYGKGSSRSSL